MVSVFLFLRHVFKPFNVVVALRNIIVKVVSFYLIEDGYCVSS